MKIFDLKGKTAIITGAGGMLGEQHAIALGEAGANILLSDIDIDKCICLQNKLKNRVTSKIHSIQCDVQIEEEWIKLRKFAIDQFSSIDILLNNAAYTNHSNLPGFELGFFEFPDILFDEIMQVNLKGTYLGCKIIGETMVNNMSGSIINFSSLYGVVSPTHHIYENTNINQPAAYSVSKSAILGLTRYLAGLFGKYNVRVNSITPGGIFNGHEGLFLSRFKELNPMKRMGKKEEIRGAVVYLASSASEYCTGQNLIVDGGWVIV